jgi:hypothetical protein
LPSQLPENVGIINPYLRNDAKEIVKKFFHKYYADNNSRKFIFGINPGRFGAGTTGIGFTDPVALKEFCGIENDLGTKRELSSQFIYEVINAYGGSEKFYSHFFVTALYPLALIKDGKNFNYYDEIEVYKQLKPEMINMIKLQINFGADKRTAICLGKKNLKYFEEINNDENIFKKIIWLEHPRYIMQYKRPKMKEYIEKYISTIHE